MRAGLWRVCTVWWVSVSLAVLPLSGCESLPPAPDTVHLAAIVIDDARLARADENVALRIWRDNVLLNVTPRMELRKGDRIETGFNVTAVIRWPGVGDGYLRPNGRAVLGSVFIDELTEFFARVHGIFSVETTHTKSAVSGTAFRVRALPRGSVEVTVYEGVVEVSSPGGDWPTAKLGAGTMAVAHPGAPRPVQVPADDLRRTHEWATRIETLVESQAGAPKAATGLALVAIAAAIAALLMARDNDKPPATGNNDSPPKRGVPNR